MNTKNYKKKVEDISNHAENSICIDCDMKNPKWVSLKYGIFMCLECAGVHRSLGIYLDVIKSIGLDSWDKEAYLPVKFGGNKKFRDYLAANNIKIDEITEKYKNNKVMEYSKNLCETIKQETGVILKSAALSNSSRNSQNKLEYDAPIKYTSYKEESKEFNHEKHEAKPSNLTSSLSGITSILSKHAKVIKEKTVVYGGKFSNAVADRAKNIFHASSDAISNLKKNKESEKKDSTFILKPRNQSKQDWS